MPPKYEVTFIESGRSYIWSRAQCEEWFGREEFVEFLAGHFPHVVVVPL